MKSIPTMILLIFFFSSCSNTKTVYWCGDHACASKKEKEAYFKKNMTIEKRVINRKKKEDKSTLDAIMDDQSLKKNSNSKNLTSKSENGEDSLKLYKKKLSKEEKLMEKKRIKEEKALTKQIRLEEKKRIKEAKKLEKQKELKKKNRIKDEKKLKKQKKLKKVVKSDSNENEILISTKIGTLNFSKDDFDDLVKKIVNINKNKPYPNLNDMPN